MCFKIKNPRKSVKSLSSVFQNLRFSKQNETRNLNRGEAEQSEAKPETETQNE